MGLRGSETQLQGCKDPLPEKHSRDIAVKVQSCLKKLRGAEGEHAEQRLQTILDGDTNPSSHLIGVTDKETSIHIDEIPRASCKTDQKSSDSVKIRRPLVFTQEEDEYVKKGYRKIWKFVDGYA